MCIAHLIVVAQHDVHTLYRGDLLRLELRVASRHGDDRRRVAAVEFADQVAAFLVGVLRDGTAVDDANIGFGRGRDAHETAALELAGEGRGLRKIELAAQGMKIDSARLHGFVFFRHEITKTARKEEAFPIKKRKFARN